MTEIGRGQRATAEGYIPSGSSFSDRALVFHEAPCLLNAADRDACFDHDLLRRSGAGRP